MDTLLTKDFVNVNEKIRQVRGAKAAQRWGRPVFGDCARVTHSETVLSGHTTGFGMKNALLTPETCHALG